MGIVYCMSALVIFISYKILYLDGGHHRYENLYSKNPNEFYSQAESALALLFCPCILHVWSLIRTY
jgi:hypothetical protein